MENENRNCGCGNMNYNMMNTSMSAYDCNYTPQGINASFGYNTAELIDNTGNNGCVGDNNQQTRENMARELKELNFAIIELGLYLDTHNNDSRALCLHREYCRQYKNLLDQYQRVYGPLTIYYPCNKWRWLEEPWPWEGGND